MLDHSQRIPCCHIRFMNVVLSSWSHSTYCKVFMILQHEIFPACLISVSVEKAIHENRLGSAVS